MLVAWIELHQTLPTNKKTVRLKNLLRIKTPQAVGHLCILWLWALDNAPDGDLSEFSTEEIAEFACWSGKNPDDFVNALIKAGFLDEDLHIHNWYDYAGKLVEKRKVDAERKRASRAKTTAGCPTDIQRTGHDFECDGAGNSTVPYRTLPYLTDISFVVDADARARETAEEIVDNYVDNRDLSMSVYFGMNPDVEREITAFTASLFKRFSLRSPTKVDVFNVFAWTKESTCDTIAGAETWRITFPEEHLKLLLYAFEQAVRAGATGNWNYINGVMRNLRQRGIKTLKDAEEYDIDRDMEKYW